MRRKTLKDIGKGYKFRQPQLLTGDDEGLYFANYQKASEHIAQRLFESLGAVPVLDLCCGVGGISIFLAKIFPHVYAVDINRARLTAAGENARKYNVFDKVTFWQGDVLDEDILRKAAAKGVKAVVADVEWRSDASHNWNEYTADIAQTIPPVTVLFDKVSTLITREILLHMPPKSDRVQLNNLGTCEIEECLYNGEVKFLNVYYGLLREQNTSVFGM